MILLLLPLFYILYAAFWICVVGTVIVLYLGVVILVFVGTAVAMAIRAIFQSERPQNPRRPSARKRPIPQAKWSDRR